MSKLPASPSFLFHCSEVAACIGDNKYKKRWEAFESIFKRIQGGKYYTEAVDRLAKLGFRVLTTNEKIDNISKNAQHTDVKSMVDDFLQKPAQTSHDLRQAIDTFELNMIAEEKCFKDQKCSLKSLLQTQLSEEEHLVREYEQIINLNENRKHQVIQEHHHQSDLFPYMPAIVTTTQGDVPLGKDEIDKMQQELSELQANRKSTAAKLLSHEKEWSDFKVAKSELIRQKQTAFGREKEDVLIQSGSIGSITSNNAELYTAVLGSEPIQWGICGRIDGFRNGELVEIKHRKSHIYNPLPIYDVIQVHCYMQILGLEKATLIQSLALGDGTFQTDETTILRDDTYWHEHILPGLKTMVACLDDFCRDSLLQDQFFQTSNAKRTFLMNKMLKKHENCKRTKTTPKISKSHDSSKITNFFRC